MSWKIVFRRGVFKKLQNYKFSYYRRVFKNASFSKFFNVVNEVSKLSGKNKAYCFFDIVRCMKRYQAGYYDYLIFHWWDKTHEQKKTYMTRFISKKFVMFMNDPSYAHYFDNKNEFYKKFKNFIGREFLDLEKANHEDIVRFFNSREEIFAKMKNLECGIGCKKLSTKDFKSADDFCDYVKEKGFAVIEDVVKNHPAIAEIYPSSINCFRVITVLDSKSVPHVLLAVFKMGINGRVVDNYGLHGPINLETGEFMFPAHSGDTTKGELYTEHPNSHKPLVGMVVPYWKEVLELAKKAALVVPQMRYIGWDIAVTPDGPLIIEGNHYTAHDFWQLPGQTPDGIGILPTIKKIIPEFNY